MKLFLDIETEKVTLETPFINPARPGSKPVRRRWAPFMIGLMIENEKGIELLEGTEDEIYDQLEDIIALYQVDEIVYSAPVRRFDEMVLRGLFLNARREFLSAPAPWRHLLDSDEAGLAREIPPLKWTNVETPVNPDPEGSRMAPVWYRTGRAEEVREHCRRDVVRLAMAAGRKSE